MRYKTWIMLALVGCLFAPAWAEEGPSGPGDRPQGPERRRERERDQAGPQARPQGVLPVTPERIDRIFQAIDADGDGKIDKDELAKRLPQLLERLQQARAPQPAEAGRGEGRGTGGREADRGGQERRGMGGRGEGRGGEEQHAAGGRDLHGDDEPAGHPEGGRGFGRGFGGFGRGREGGEADKADHDGDRDRDAKERPDRDGRGGPERQLKEKGGEEHGMPGERFGRGMRGDGAGPRERSGRDGECEAKGGFDRPARGYRQGAGPAMGQPCPMCRRAPGGMGGMDAFQGPAFGRSNRERGLGLHGRMMERGAGFGPRGPMMDREGFGPRGPMMEGGKGMGPHGRMMPGGAGFGPRGPMMGREGFGPRGPMMDRGREAGPGRPTGGAAPELRTGRAAAFRMLDMNSDGRLDMREIRDKIERLQRLLRRRAQGPVGPQAAR